MKDKTLLHRQIHPSFVVNDVVSLQAFTENSLTISSGAFTPTSKDENKLSVYNGDKFSAKESHEHYTTHYDSYGVLSISVEEVESIPMLTSAEDNLPFDGHSHINFSLVLSKTQKTKKAGKLRDLAVQRNWTFKREK